MKRYRMSQLAGSSYICALLCLLCVLASPGCKQKAEEPAPQQSQQSQAPNDVNTASIDAQPKPAPEESPVATAPESPAEFTLEEISVFDLPQRIRTRFTRGQYVMLQKEPQESAKAYPDFESNTPLYGLILIGAEPDKPDSGACYHFALDESLGPDRGYDWFYFDNDCDGDLSDEIATRPMSNPPDGARMPYGSDVTQVCFNNVNLEVGRDSDESRKIELMPRLLAFNGESRYVCFVATRARKGLISMGGRKFDAFLGHSHQIGGALDLPTTAFHLLPAQNQSNPMPSWIGSEQLMAMQRVGDKLYRFSATPKGDKLFIRPYEGPFGIFEIGAGGREVEKMSAQGGLQSEDTAVPVSHQLGKSPNPAGTRSCRLPVGDYLPVYMTITYGDLQIAISDNYHSDADSRNAPQPKRVYGIKLREEETFTFDFSNDPAVIFASPATNHRLKRGEELRVTAALIDSVFNIMIRGLYDKSSGGRSSLDPKITIARADGQVVAEGPMPFG